MTPRRFLRPLALTFALLSATCLALQFWDNVHVVLLRWDGQRSRVIQLHEGRLHFSSRPRVPQRPRWAGQVNRYGFRYNVYSDGSWYAWAPLWAPGTMFAAAALLNAHAARPGRAAPGLCARCGYDLRASPERCPECGNAAPAHSSADASSDRDPRAV